MDVRSGARCWLCPALSLACLIGSVDTASAEFAISRFTIDGGGGTRAMGGAFALGGTVGQPDAGRLTGMSFVLNGGFWFGGVVVSAVPDDPRGGGSGPPTAPGPPFLVHAASPNPVTQRTVIAFDLPEPTPVRAALYDVTGRLLTVLIDQPLPAGRHQATWDLRDDSGRLTVPGIYFLRLYAGLHRSTQRIVVIH
jgi:hypothetical protein